MANEKRNIEINFNTNAEQTASKVDGLTNSIDKTTVAIEKQEVATRDLTKEVTSNGGAMSILDSLTGGYASQLKNAYEATNIFTKGTIASTAGMKGATIASRTLRVALASIGIGLLVSAVGYLVANWDSLKKSFTDFLPSIGLTSDAFDKVKAVVVGVGGAVIDYLIAPVRAFIKLVQGDFKGAVNEIVNGYNVVGNYNKAKNEQIARDNQKAMDEDFAEYVANEQRKIERARNRGEDVDKLERNLLQKKIGYYKKDSEEYKKAVQDFENFNDKIITERKRTAERNRQERIAAAQREAERRKQIEEQLLSELKAINEDYQKWLTERGELNPSDSMIADNLKQIEKLNEAKKKATINGEIDIYNEQIKMYEERNRELETINYKFGKLLSYTPLAEEGGLMDNIQRLIVGDEFDFSIKMLSNFRTEVDNFLSSIKNSDLKAYYTTASQSVIKTTESSLNSLKSMNDAYNEYTKANSDEFLINLRERQGDINQWEALAISSYSNVLNSIDEEFRITEIKLKTALADRLISQKAFDDSMENLKSARRLREEEAEQDHIDRLNQIDDERLNRKRANYEAEISIVNASADAQAATLDMVLSFMSKEDEEKAKATGAYKTLAIATATMDTYAAAIAGYRGAMQTFANPIVGNIVGIASIATAVSTGIAQINAIRKVKVQGASGGGSTPSVSAGATPNVQFVSSSENQIANSVNANTNAQNQEPIKAYVVTSEVETGLQLGRKAVESNSL